MCLLSIHKLRLTRLTCKRGCDISEVNPLQIKGIGTHLLFMWLVKEIRFFLSGQKKIDLSSAQSQVRELARRQLVRSLHISCLAVVLSEARNRAATRIQRTVRGWLVREHLRTYVKLGSKYSFVLRCKADQVELRAEFTSPPWTEPIPLKFVPILGAFCTDHLLKSRVPLGTFSYKFIIDGVWSFDNARPLKTDASGHVNNIIKLDKVFGRHSHPRRSTYAPKAPAQSLSIRVALQGKLGGLNTEDAYFISEPAKAFGVADGVGSWTSVGVNPSLFPTELMNQSQQLSEKFCRAFMPLTPDLLQEVAGKAHLKTSAYGSSTMVLASIINSTLNFYLIGDSRICVLRIQNGKYKMIFMTKEQQHGFNCPFQLSHLPSEDQFSHLKTTGFSKFVQFLETTPSLIQDTVSKGTAGSISLNKHDIVILGTDGLFDNLFQKTIVEIVNRSANLEPSDLGQAIADALLEFAVAASKDELSETPFSTMAKNHGISYSGGKPDDITVVVAVNS